MRQGPLSTALGRSEREREPLSIRLKQGSFLSLSLKEKEGKGGVGRRLRARLRDLRGRGREPPWTLSAHQISIDTNLLVSIMTVSQGTVFPGRALLMAPRAPRRRCQSD